MIPWYHPFSPRRNGGLLRARIHAPVAITGDFPARPTCPVAAGFAPASVILSVAKNLWTSPCLERCRSLSLRALFLRHSERSEESLGLALARTPPLAVIASEARQSPYFREIASSSRQAGTPRNDKGFRLAAQEGFSPGRKLSSRTEQDSLKATGSGYSSPSPLLCFG